MATSALIGTWRLLQVRAFDTAGNPVADHPYGPEPTGIVQFGRHRMQGAVGDGRTALPPGTRRFWFAYTGPYSFDGETLITRIDATNNPGRIASDHIRKVRFEGETAWLIPPPREIGGVMTQLELQWERVSP